MEYEYMSIESLQKLKEELNNLKYRKRPVISQKVATAREHGDLKENAEYHAAREELSFMETKILQLEDRISRTRVIKEEDLPNDKVYILKTVKLKDLKFDDILEYTLVSSAEANFEENKIAVTSPIGKALLGKAVGDSVEVQAPAGILKYEVLEIK
ncbi:MAG: transcription elongation factor GreA [Calditrichales bacterium]|nr:MAG: transcription elongation factor GreA [Calditrichales bacterium]